MLQLDLPLSDSIFQFRNLRRKVRKFFARKKHLKIQKQFLEFQKYSLICFIGNSKKPVDVPHKIDLDLLFKIFMNAAVYYCRKFYALICLWILNPLKHLLSFIGPMLGHEYFLGFITAVGIIGILSQRLFKKHVKKYIKFWDYFNKLILWLIWLAILALLIHLNKQTKYIQIITNILLRLKNGIYHHSKDLIGPSHYYLNPKPKPLEKLKGPEHRFLKGVLVFCIVSSLGSVGILRWYKREFVRTFIDDDRIINVLVEIYDQFWSDLPDLPNPFFLNLIN